MSLRIGAANQRNSQSPLAHVPAHNSSYDQPVLQNILAQANIQKENPDKQKAKRVFIDNSIAGILTNQQSRHGVAPGARENNPIGQLRTSLNEPMMNPRSSLTNPLHGDKIESGENHRNLAMRQEIDNFLNPDKM